MNNIVIKGRLTFDPELKYVQVKGEDKAVCRFPVAVDRNFGEETDFFNCSAWGKTAEFINKFFSKGKEILILGSMESNKVEKDGKNITYWQLNVNRVEFCGKKDDTAPSANKAEPPVDEYEGKTADDLYKLCLENDIKVDADKDRSYYVDRLRDDLPF